MILKGVMAELNDSAFPLLENVVITSDLRVAFQDSDYNFLIGAKPRGPGMPRTEFLIDNGNNFVEIGKAMNDSARRTSKTVVIGTPANTNALICSKYATDIPEENITAMTRLDHNRAINQISQKTGVKCSEIKKMAIWGNHSLTLYPDLRNVTIRGEEIFNFVDSNWFEEEFIPRVQMRGTEIMK